MSLFVNFGFSRPRVSVGYNYTNSVCAYHLMPFTQMLSYSPALPLVKRNGHDHSKRSVALRLNFKCHRAVVRLALIPVDAVCESSEVGIILHRVLHISGHQIV